MSRNATPSPSRTAQIRATAARARQRRRLVTVGAVLAAVAVLVGVVLATTASDDSEPDADAASTNAEGMSFEMIDGTSASLADYRGKPLVVNFFASWCVPCLAEMPGFERVHQNLDGQVAFLGINLQDRREDGLRIVEQTGVTYDIARDPDGSIFQNFGAVAMPTTVLINADGTIVDLHSGEISADGLADRIERVLLS